jgi:hypothetical protein
MMFLVRTTVTLDPDVERLLKEEIHRSRQSFKEVLNNAIRQGLRPSASKRRKPFVVKARSMGLRTGIDPARLTELADDLEVDAFQELTKKLGRENR